MKRGLSTGKPTKREADRIVACKEGPCIACLVFRRKLVGADFHNLRGNDYHHLISGGRRRGHRYGIGLCRWHHLRQPSETEGFEWSTAYYGPSLMDGSRLFHETYGSDDELLAVQDQLIGWIDE